MLITVAAVLGVIVAIGVQWAADRLAEGLSDRLEAISPGMQEISEAAGERSDSHPPCAMRTIAAEPGTRLAYVIEADGNLQIGYAQVLAFVESGNPRYWESCALIGGEGKLSDCFIDRIVLPGQSLSGMRRDEERIRRHIVCWLAEARDTTCMGCV